MSIRGRIVRLMVAAGLVTAWTDVAQAQPLGTFSWQLQPFCNKVTVNVTQNGGVYTLDGFDDQCGAPQRAPLVGLATPNPDGTIGFGLHIATSPGGKTVSVEARVSLGTIGGPWTDSGGNSGTLVLNGSAAGAARPAPVTGPVWGTSLSAPSAAAGTGIVLRTASSGASNPPPALVVESTPPSGVTITSGATGIVANVGRGTAVFGHSDTGAGIVGSSAATTSFSAGVVALGSANSFGLWARTVGASPAVYAEGGLAPALWATAGDTSSILAEGGADGSAIRLSNGGFTLSGTIRPAFVHTATAGNVFAARTVVDHPLLNNKPTAIVTASYLYTPSVGFLAGGVGMFYDTAAGRWSVIRNDGTVMPANARFNVIVFNHFVPPPE